jgi:hypothetical protein
VLTFASLDPSRVTAVVTTRAGGVSRPPYESLNLGLHVGDDDAAVVENRTRAAAAIGLRLDALVFGEQVHGREVAVVGAAERGRGTRRLDDAVPGVDALVTATPGVGLVVLVADCSPIVLHDPDRGILGVVHAGWRGAVARVAAAALDAMERLGASRTAVLAGIGPTVPPTTYEVGAEVASAARGAFGSAADALVVPGATGRFRFDVAAANEHVLVDAGVPPTNVERLPVATDDERCYSHRRARPTGRFGLLATLVA